MFDGNVLTLALNTAYAGYNIVSNCMATEEDNWEPIAIQVVEPFSIENDGIPWTNTENMTPHEYSFWVAFRALYIKYGFGYLMDNPDHFIETQPPEEQERYRQFRALPEVQRYTRIHEELMQYGHCNVSVMYDPMLGEQHYMLL